MENKLDILKECEAFLQGHFLLSSGRHSNAYCQMAKLQQYPDKTEIIIKEVANKLKDMEIDVIVGPAMGGIVYAYELGRQLNKRTIFTERVDNEMTLRRGFEINKGEKCLIMEDVVTTGISSLETKRVIEQWGGECIGIACVVDRSKGTSPLKVIASAFSLNLDTYTEDECPICKQGNLPLVKPGSRKF